MAQYFNLTLDTTAPSSGIISGLESYYNSSATVSLSASGASFMKVWTNSSASGAITDSTYPTTWEPYDISKTVTFSGDGTQYVHAQFMDEVGNIGVIVNSSATIYDTIAPTISAVSINNNDGYTNHLEDNIISISLQHLIPANTYTIGDPQISRIVLSGDYSETIYPSSFSTVSANTSSDPYDVSVGFQKTFSFPSGTQDGTKTITVTVYDEAGNVSASVSDTIILDTTPASITAILREEDDSANLPLIVNYLDYGVRIVTNDNDITHYKIWEGASADEPDTWINISNATQINNVGYFIDNLSLSNEEGWKNIWVKVKDLAGNVTSSFIQNYTNQGIGYSVYYDITAPNDINLTNINHGAINNSRSFSFNLSAYEQVKGHYNQTTGTPGPSNRVDGSIDYIIKLGSTILKQGVLYHKPDIFSLGTYYSAKIKDEGGLTGEKISISGSEISAISPEDGTKTLTIEITDKAGNVGVSNYSFILDNTAPTGSVIANQYYNTSTVTVNVAGSDTGGAGMEYKRVWLDNTEPSNWSVYNDSQTLTNVAEGQHTAHVQFEDRAGNRSTTYDSSSFIVDTTAPTGTITGPTYTNTRSITINISASDAKSGVDVTSGVSQMKVWEAGTTIPTWEAYATTKSITLTTGDGSKTINAKFKDAAGNESTIVTCNVVLDTDEPDVTLALTKTDGTTVLPAKVNVRGFNARIGFTNETQDSPIVSYKLTGDFTTSSDTWQTFTVDSGKSYMTIPDLEFTTGDGLKTIIALLMDEAGNISATGATASATYDATPPVIDVNAPDYNKVSKEHTSRLTSAGVVITGKYNDMCTFTWSANEALQAFKVCVNEVGQTAAGATPIGTTNGSQNMNGGAVEANTDVTSVIFGTDFAATDAVNDTDGAYEVIVYGQDESGTWSAIHVMSPSGDSTPDNAFTLSNGDILMTSDGNIFVPNNN